MTIRFYLHSKVYANSPKRAIYMEARFPEQPAAYHSATLVLRKSTGKKCEPAYFTDKQRVKKDPKAHEINTRLNKLEQWAGEVVEQARLDKQKLTPELLWERMMERDEDGPPLPAPVQASAPTGPPTIAEVAAQWVAHNKHKYSHNHLRKMQPLVQHWENFRPGTTIVDLLPDPRTRQSTLVEQWISYLLEEAPQRDGSFGMESNSAGGYIRWLRLLLKFTGHPFDWLTDELTYEVEIEPLLFEEVMQYYEAPLQHETHQRARDCFVFNCLTGPRYGNLQKLGPESVVEIDGVHILEYVQIKGRRNKRKVRVALDPLALEIWQRWQGRLPVYSNDKMNQYIKEAAQLAGLDRPVLQVRQKGTQRVEVHGPLWQFITCHTARHTFGTLLLDGGADLGAAQDGLGHANLQTTRRYAKSREKQRHVNTLSAFEKLRQSHTAA